MHPVYRWSKCTLKSINQPTVRPKKHCLRIALEGHGPELRTGQEPGFKSCSGLAMSRPKSWWDPGPKRKNTSNGWVKTTVILQRKNLESRWRNSHVLVSHLLGVAPSAFTMMISTLRFPTSLQKQLQDSKNSFSSILWIFSQRNWIWYMLVCFDFGVDVDVCDWQGVCFALSCSS